MDKRSFLGAAFALALGTMTPASAFATGQSDIVAGLNALPLMINKITGDTTMAIVYDPEDAVSAADAADIKKIVDEGIAIPGGGRLSAILVGVGELGKLSRVQIAFLTPGLSVHFSHINIVTSAASILTITTDLDCVRAEKCIIGVATKPNLAVYYSKPAADAAKIEFSQEFAMLVKQF